MASPNISLLGATYNGVAGVTLPKSGGGTATFPWVEGSQTYTTNGTYDVSGLAEAVVSVSGGGGATPKWGVLRSDAELVKTVTYDKLLVANEGITIPSYSTSAKTLITSANLSVETVNISTYDYVVTFVSLTYPIYDTDTKSSARMDYNMSSAQFELVSFPANSIHSLDNTKTYTSSLAGTFTATNQQGKTVYWSSASAIKAGAAYYGVYATPPTPTISSSSLTLTSPAYTMRGSSTYLNSTNWGHITDIRAQYIIQLYRVPVSSSIQGFMQKSSFQHIHDCAISANHTLTT